MQHKRWWAWLALIGISAGLGWWERHPPGWMSLDPLRHPFGAKYLEPAMPQADVPEAVESSPPPTGPVFVNWADADELISLPGVGAVTARRILEMRDSRGLFQRPEDLLEVKGIGPKTLERMIDRLRFDRPSPASGD